MKVRSSSDQIFVLRQLREKLKDTKNVTFQAFIDQNKRMREWTDRPCSSRIASGSPPGCRPDRTADAPRRPRTHPPPLWSIPEGSAPWNGDWCTTGAVSLASAGNVFPRQGGRKEWRRFVDSPAAAPMQVLKRVAVGHPCPPTTCRRLRPGCYE